MSNPRFANALARRPQAVPPIWFMRQAGRYHKHYQKLRAQHSFMELCKNADLAAAVTLGPIEDFDFDVAIIFSDLLFPLEALGMGLEYPEGSGPKLGWLLNAETLPRLRTPAEALPQLQFQKTAIQKTRAALAADKSLIGFVGSPWTLFTYATEGAHAGNLLRAKSQLELFPKFCDTLIPLLTENIQLQLAAGAEVVMLFDTAAGELSPELFQSLVLPQLQRLAQPFPARLGYYSKGTQGAHLAHDFFFEGPLAGIGVDHRWSMTHTLAQFRSGFVQGNFDQSLFFAPRPHFEAHVYSYLERMRRLDPEARRGWVCGLGHGVLPQTPEEHVRFFVRAAREVLGS